MRERRALRRAAWRELWPAALLAVGCAIAIAYSNAVGLRPGSMWIGLWLVPAALLCGTTVGRSTPRMLAFMFARPVRRERVLGSRIVVALGSLAVAWATVVIAVVARDPHLGAWLDAVMVAGALALALLCGALGSTATDREPLALGIGTLVFSSMACVPLVGAEALDITLARTIASGPFVVVLALAVGVFGVGRAVLGAWRDGLPVRDARTIRALVTSCAGAWVVAEALAVVQIWRSASPAGSVPMIVLGADDRGIIVASGSPQSLDGADAPRIDAVHVGTEDPFVAFAVGRRSFFEGAGLVGVVTRAVAANGKIAVELTTFGSPSSCSVVIVDRGAGTRDVDVACGRMSLSPSGRSLAVASKTELAVVDLESAEVRVRIETPIEHEVFDWSDEVPMSRERRRASAGRTGVIGWLDAEHRATVDSERGESESTISIVEVSSGEVVAAFPRGGMLPITALDGPPRGPWIANRSGVLIQALDTNGAVLWSEPVATFERDEPDARRWAIVDGEVVGIDPRGRWWSHEVPWEVTP